MTRPKLWDADTEGWDPEPAHCDAVTKSWDPEPTHCDAVTKGGFALTCLL